MNRDLNDYQNRYRQQPYEAQQVQFRQRKILETLNKYPHRTLLEVGCGLEPIYKTPVDFDRLYIVEPAPQFYQTAVDVSLNHGKRSNIVFINKMIEDCGEDLAGIKFDFILISALLHEVADPVNILRTIYKLAARDTVIHINVPNARSFHRLLAVEMGLIKDVFQPSKTNQQLQQHSIFDQESLNAMVEKSGFDILESGSFAFKPFTHQQMQQLINTGALNTEMLDGLYQMEKYLPGLGSEIFVNIRKK